MLIPFIKLQEKTPKEGLFIFCFVLILISSIPSCTKEVRIPKIKEETNLDTDIKEPAPEQIFGGSYETMPEFPGGLKGFQEFLHANARLPTSGHKSSRIRIYLSFIIDEEGKLSEIEVIRGAAERYNHEAIRIMKASPPWIPGKAFGKPIMTRMNLRISFSEDGPG